MVLQQLFQVRPLRLHKLADFLERQVIAGGDFYSLADFTERFFELLPFWEFHRCLPVDNLPIFVERKALLS